MSQAPDKASMFPARSLHRFRDFLVSPQLPLVWPRQQTPPSDSLLFPGGDPPIKDPEGPSGTAPPNCSMPLPIKF